MWQRLGEYYYDSRKEGRQKTDGEYVEALQELVGTRSVTRVIVDPSAASFIQALRQPGFPLDKPASRLRSGTRVHADPLRHGKIVICSPCRDAIREFSLYRWDEKPGRDAPVKEHDHAMDDIRYFAVSLAGREEAFVSLSVER